MNTEEYLSIFIDESKEHLQKMNESLLALENEPDNIEWVQIIFRSAHTLKGMSATMGYENLAELTHKMEDVLDAVRNQQKSITPPLMDLLFQAADALEAMVLSIEQGGNDARDVAGLAGRLAAVLNPQSPSSLEAGAKGSTGMVLEDFELEALKQSKSMNLTPWHVEITVSETSVLKSARAYMAYYAAEALGEIVKISPTVEEIESDDFAGKFQFILLSAKTANEVQQILSDISEIEHVGIREYLIEDKQEKADKAKALSQSGQSPSKPSAGTGRAAAAKSLRVDAARIDTLINLLSELVIDRGRLETLAAMIGNADLSETVEHINRVTSEFQDIILKLRMVPIEQVFNRFPRMLRDLSKELNKSIDFRMEGEETELDRGVVDEIGDPLVHLLRNAVDHGVERPEVRRSNGKPETGSILLKAYPSGNHVYIEIRDDGAGIQKDKVLKKALERNILTENEAGRISDKEVYQLLFHPGFSTAEKITDVSGRGVGLDVVKTKIESLGGTVEVDSSLGAGSTFTIQLPLSLAILEALLVRVHKDTFAIPLSSIEETAIFQKTEIQETHKQQVIYFRDQIIPLVYLSGIFGYPVEESAKHHVVIVKKSDRRLALVVDDFIQQQEVVLKPLGSYIKNPFAISGGTILGNGRVALIIDCNALFSN
jgi:two-component system chemotaxis sensor kinase CheA